MAKKLDFVVPAIGGVAGANLSAYLGNIGLVGGFGGISVGLVGMTGMGILTSSAIYASVQGLETNDRTVGLALGMGSLGGIGIYSTLGVWESQLKVQLSLLVSVLWRSLVG